jgi:hypothetical protein
LLRRASHGKISGRPGNFPVQNRPPVKAIATGSESSSMIDDTSLEFDMFEDMRRKLVELFVTEGYERIEAEKIALYVVQGVREVPKLLSALAEIRSHSHREVLKALSDVLENAHALDKAKEMLIEHEREEQE